jgi:hypothetical protein
MGKVFFIGRPQFITMLDNGRCNDRITKADNYADQIKAAPLNIPSSSTLQISLAFMGLPA